MGADIRVWEEEKRGGGTCPGKEEERKKMAREGEEVTQIKKNGKKLKVDEEGKGKLKIMTLSETEYDTIVGTNMIPSIFGS